MPTLTIYVKTRPVSGAAKNIPDFHTVQTLSMSVFIVGVEECRGHN